MNETKQNAMRGKHYVDRIYYEQWANMALRQHAARHWFFGQQNHVYGVYRVAQKTGPAYLIANILKTPWPNCVEIGELLQYYMLNTVINFFV